MSLDVSLYIQRDGDRVVVFESNITHNLAPMAGLAGCYNVVWRPDENAITTASQLIRPIQDGIRFMEDNKRECENLNPSNGWGDYKGLLRFLREYLDACIEYPEAEVGVSR